MGQKIHPVGFRLGITKSHQSQWFTTGSIYSNLIVEDYFIRNTLFKKFINGAISKIEIQRKFSDQIQLILYSSKPNLILTSYENNLKKLSDDLVLKIQKNRKKNFQNLSDKEVSFQNFKNLYSSKPKITIQIFELPIPDENVNFIADSLVKELQKRVAFRRAMKKALRRAKRAKVKGVKIQISGRLNGAEIARSEWTRQGRIPLQTLRAKIDYCYRTAKTIYGILGIKVWVYKK